MAWAMSFGTARFSAFPATVSTAMPAIQCRYGLSRVVTPGPAGRPGRPDCRAMREDPTRAERRVSARPGGSARPYAIPCPRRGGHANHLWLPRHHEGQGTLAALAEAPGILRQVRRDEHPHVRGSAEPEARRRDDGRAGHDGLRGGHEDAGRGRGD